MKFSSYDAMFKHTQRHYEFMHLCAVCDKISNPPHRWKST